MSDKVTNASKAFARMLKEQNERVPQIYNQDVLLNYFNGEILLCGGRGLMFEFEGKRFQVRPTESIRIPWSKFVVEEY